MISYIAYVLTYLDRVVLYNYCTSLYGRERVRTVERVENY